MSDFDLSDWRLRPPVGFRGAAIRLAEDAPEWDACAAQLGVEPAHIRAVAEVESRGEPFLPSGRPPILFERHQFSRRTRGIHDAFAPAVSHPNSGGYGEGGEAQYDRLEAALKLDEKAALACASWGRFQIMGFNFAMVGFKNVRQFVAGMCHSEAVQLQAFAAFIKANGLADERSSARPFALMNAA
ncbi:MAG: N-acetylmuramidase family protein, partial [Pseudomonadota bacterium]